MVVCAVVVVFAVMVVFAVVVVCAVVVVPSVVVLELFDVIVCLVGGLVRLVAEEEVIVTRDSEVLEKDFCEIEGNVFKVEFDALA